MRIYLDTNVLRDYMENRNQKSIELIECIRQKNLECFTSTFSMMELSDLQKDTLFFHKKIITEKWDVDRFLRQRKNKDLSSAHYEEVNDYLNNITTKLSFLKFANLNAAENWDIAKYISSHSPLSAVDTIHLTTAYTAGCNLLVTRDEQLVSAGNKILDVSARKDDIVILSPEAAILKL